MNRAALILGIGLLVAVVAVLPAHTQQVALLSGTVVSAAGVPVTNQPIFIEREAAPFSIWQLFKKAKPVKVIAITDGKGSFQAVDLPPGKYKVSILGSGATPADITKFDLQAGYDTVTLKEVRLPEKLQFFEGFTPEKIPGAPEKPQQ